MSGPPPALVAALVDGPSVLSGLCWHERVDSTNRLAAEAAARGVPEVHAVLADVQTAGRGRAGRGWQAPAGSSLLLSLVLRPRVAAESLPLLPLLAGLALLEATRAFAPAAAVALKWPNDLLVGGRKAAGVLAEAAPGGAVVLGCGVNVDWRALPRPPGADAAVSLAEAAGGPVDRWRVLAAFVGVLGNRYRGWQAEPSAFLDDYRAVCATLGAQVRAEGADGRRLRGLACGVGVDGTLELRHPDGRGLRLSAGDVHHVRPA